MILTMLEGTVDPMRAADLEAAFRAGESPMPAGLMRSELIRSASDPTRWRIQTLWESRAALDAMRGKGTPAGVLMFRAAGGEPTLSIFEVVAQLPAERGS